MTVSNRWLTIFLILPHLSIYYFNMEGVQTVVYIWQALVVVVATFILFKKLTVLNVFIAILMIVMLLSSLINGTLSGGIFFSTIVLVSLCIYISYANQNPREFFKGLYYLFSTLIVINFFTVITGGITIDLDANVPIYLFGGKNAFSMTLLPAIAMIMVYSYITFNKLKITPLVIIIIGIASIFMTGSGTGIIISLLIIMFILGWKKPFPSLGKYLIIYSILFFSIVIFRLQEVLLGDFIANTLQKSTTFTGRTYIWDYVIGKIGDSWLLGFGRGTDLISQYFVNVNETHNGVLEILFYGGVVGLSLFSIIIVKVSKNLSMFRMSVVSKVLSFSIFGYMVLGLSESVFLKKEFWMLLVISYGISHLVKVSGNFANKEINQQ